METHISVLPWPNPGGVGNSGVSSVDRAGSGVEWRVCGGSPREGTFLPAVDGGWPKCAVLRIVARGRGGVSPEVRWCGAERVVRPGHLSLGVMDEVHPS